MLYIEYNFYRWLADVGPTLARRSKSRWPNVGSQRRTDGRADVGPTSVRRRNAIWVVLVQEDAVVSVISDHESDVNVIVKQWRAPITMK